MSQPMLTLCSPRSHAAHPTRRGDVDVLVRPIPSPYRAMLAISSDLDETPDRHVYWETMRFLNTTSSTSMGPGVGLEVGNSIYFDMPSDQFSYWNTDESGRVMVQTLIQSGHIDVLHSFGDLTMTRAQAGHALEELARHNCRLQVWIDHAVAPSNFGGDIMRGVGDVPGSPVYHADLSRAYGIDYVWRGRVTSVPSQGVRRRLRGILSRKMPIASLRTAAKELAKGWLGCLGSVQYTMHATNEILRCVVLRDGQRVREFLRTNPHPGGVSCGETADGLPQVLTPRLFARLIERGGVSVLYTHLGKVSNRRRPFGSATCAALRHLAAFVSEGKLLVTTTQRLLAYRRTVQDITMTAEPHGEWLTLRITGAELLANWQGLSFYVPDPAHTRVVINGVDVTTLRAYGPDHTGRPSVSLPWHRLVFPEESARSRL